MKTNDSLRLPQVALITGSQMPKPDSETHLLVEELESLNVRTSVIAWDEQREWSAIPLVVLRTPWGYFLRIDEFLTWTQKVAQVTRLLNPYPVVKWNAHKSYLLDLQQQGVPIVPTKLVPAAALRDALGDDLYPDEIVIKPAISAGAFGAMKGRIRDPQLNSQIELVPSGDYLVQPFVSDIAVNGEVSLIFFDGQFSHAVQKRPAPGDYRVQDRFGGTVVVYRPGRPEHETASAALEAAPGKTAYARVDLVNWLGKPAVMELELIEPELFLRVAPSAQTVFAGHLQAELMKG